MANAPQLELLYHANIELGPPTPIGDTPHGHRIIIPILGGMVEGPRLNGKVLPGGADALLIRPDGVSELDVRMTFETDDGALLYSSYRGYATNVPAVMPLWASGQDVPDDMYSIVAMPMFETSSADYAWLQQSAFVASVRLQAGGVRYTVYQFIP